MVRIPVLLALVVCLCSAQGTTTTKWLSIRHCESSDSSCTSCTEPSYFKYEPIDENSPSKCMETTWWSYHFEASSSSSYILERYAGSSCSGPVYGRHSYSVGCSPYPAFTSSSSYKHFAHFFIEVTGISSSSPTITFCKASDCSSGCTLCESGSSGSCNHCDIRKSLTTKCGSVALLDYERSTGTMLQFRFFGRYVDVNGKKTVKLYKYGEDCTHDILPVMETSEDTTEKKIYTYASVEEVQEPPTITKWLKVQHCDDSGCSSSRCSQPQYYKYSTTAGVFSSDCVATTWGSYKVSYQLSSSTLHQTGYKVFYYSDKQCSNRYSDYDSYTYGIGCTSYSYSSSSYRYVQLTGISGSSPSITFCKYSDCSSCRYSYTVTTTCQSYRDYYFRYFDSVSGKRTVNMYSNRGDCEGDALPLLELIGETCEKMDTYTSVEVVDEIPVSPAQPPITTWLSIRHCESSDSSCTSCSEPSYFKYEPIDGSSWSRCMETTWGAYDFRFRLSSFYELFRYSGSNCSGRHYDSITYSSGCSPSSYSSYYYRYVQLTGISGSSPSIKLCKDSDCSSDCSPLDTVTAWCKHSYSGSDSDYYYRYVDVNGKKTVKLYKHQRDCEYDILPVMEMSKDTGAGTCKEIRTLGSVVEVKEPPTTTAQPPTATPKWFSIQHCDPSGTSCTSCTEPVYYKYEPTDGNSQSACMDTVWGSYRFDASSSSRGYVLSRYKDSSCSGNRYDSITYSSGCSPSSYSSSSYRYVQLTGVSSSSPSIKLCKDSDCSSDCSSRVTVTATCDYISNSDSYYRYVDVNGKKTVKLYKHQRDCDNDILPVMEMSEDTATGTCKEIYTYAFVKAQEPPTITKWLKVQRCDGCSSSRCSQPQYYKYSTTAGIVNCVATTWGSYKVSPGSSTGYEVSYYSDKQCSNRYGDSYTYGIGCTSYSSSYRYVQLTGISSSRPSIKFCSHCTDCYLSLNVTTTCESYRDYYFRYFGASGKKTVKVYKASDECDYDILPLLEMSEDTATGTCKAVYTFLPVALVDSNPTAAPASSELVWQNCSTSECGGCSATRVYKVTDGCVTDGSASYEASAVPGSRWRVDVYKGGTCAGAASETHTGEFGCIGVDKKQAFVVSGVQGKKYSVCLADAQCKTIKWNDVEECGIFNDGGRCVPMDRGNGYVTITGGEITIYRSSGDCSGGTPAYSMRAAKGACTQTSFYSATLGASNSTDQKGSVSGAPVPLAAATLWTLAVWLLAVCLI